MAHFPLDVTIGVAKAIDAPIRPSKSLQDWHLPESRFYLIPKQDRRVRQRRRTERGGRRATDRGGTSV
jgi:hypothetical protein